MQQTAEYLSTNLLLSESELEQLRSHLVASNTTEIIHVPPSAYLHSNRSSLSIYFSVKSRFSTITASSKSRFSTSSSLLTNSTGRQSVPGATWRESMSLTANSGFGPERKPRSMGEKGTRQGREKNLGREGKLAVGRIGKGPAHVPGALVDAMRRVREYRLFARRKLSTVHEDQDEDDDVDEEEVQRSEEVAMAMLKDSHFVSEGLQELPKPFLTLVSTHLWGPGEEYCWSPSEKRYLPYSTYEEGGFQGWHYKEGERFEVLIHRGGWCLARKQGDRRRVLGWIRYAHCGIILDGVQNLNKPPESPKAGEAQMGSVPGHLDGIGLPNSDWI